MGIIGTMTQGRAEVARKAHILEVAGSSPAPANRRASGHPTCRDTAPDVLHGLLVQW